MEIAREDEIPVAQQETEEVSLRYYLAIILRRKWLILACMVVAFGVVLVQSYYTTPLYRATAELVRDTSSLESALFGTRVFEYWDVQRELSTSADMVTSPEVAEAVKVKLGSSLSAQALSGMISATAAKQTDFISITATSASPQEATDVANAFASEYIVIRRQNDQTAIELALQVVEAQLSRMTALELAGDRGRMLSSRLEELAIISELQTGGYKVARMATVPGTPFVPQTQRSGMLAVLVGLVVGIGLSFLIEYLDRRIKDEDAAARAFGLPVVGTVPLVGKKWKEPTKKEPRSAAPVGFQEHHSPTLESFRAIRSNLQYFTVDRDLTTILVTSSLPREGKTITTINLGLALALSGARVAIIDADLRKPALHRYLNLPNDVGLTSVLAGSRNLLNAFQLIQVDSYLSPEKQRAGGLSSKLAQQKNLYVMTSGPIPPNPTELLSSSRMAELLERTARSADYVLLDSPPVLLVADAVALASMTHGVLLTCRLYHTTVDAARESRLLLDRAQAELLGVVVEGLKHRSGHYSRYGYRRYGYGYSHRYGNGYGSEEQDDGTEEGSAAGGSSVV